MCLFLSIANSPGVRFAWGLDWCVQTLRWDRTNTISPSSPTQQSGPHWGWVLPRMPGCLWACSLAGVIGCVRLIEGFVSSSCFGSCGCCDNCCCLSCVSVCAARVAALLELLKPAELPAGTDPCVAVLAEDACSGGAPCIPGTSWRMEGRNMAMPVACFRDAARPACVQVFHRLITRRQPTCQRSDSDNR